MIGRTVHHDKKSQRSVKVAQRKLLWGVLGALAVVGFLAWILISGFDRENIPPHSIRLAFLPFDTVSDSPEDESLSLGLRYSTITDLLHYENAREKLWFVPIEEMEEAGVLGVEDVHEAFDVHQVISGVLVYDSALIRVTLDVIDAKTLRLMHSTTFSLNRNEPSKIQHEIADQLAHYFELERKLGNENQRLSPESYDALAYSFYLQGLGYLNRFDVDGYVDIAIDQFTQAIEIENNFAPAYASLCRAQLDKYYAGKNDPDLYIDAFNNCKATEKLASQLPDVLTPLGNFYLWSGRISDAKASLKKAIEVDDTYAEAYLWLARVYEREIKMDSAIVSFNKAIELQPNVWFYYQEFGTFLIQVGYHREAISVLEKVVALSPDNYLPYSSLGVSYKSLGDYKKAEEYFLKAHQLRKNTPLPIRNLGTLYFGLGSYDTAVEQYEKAVALDDYVSYFFLGHAHYWDGDLAEADDIWRIVVELSEQRLEINANDFVSRTILADAYLSLGDLEKSQEHLSILEEIPELNLWVWFLSGRMHERMGNRGVAIAKLVYALTNNFDVYMIRNDPWLTDLQKDPRFKPVMDAYLEQVAPTISSPSP